MSNYIPTSSNNPCPICDKTNGNCRTFNDSELVLCMTGVGGSHSDNGYRYLGDTKDGAWAKYVPNQSTVTNSEYQKYIDALEESLINQRMTDDLTLAEIDSNIRLMLSYLTLTKEHHQQLIKRGLNDEQIKKGGYKSITGFHSLPQVSVKIAGVYIGRGGEPTIGYASANELICPIRNKDGLFIGYQKQTPNKDRKYIWAKTSEKKENGKTIRYEVTSHLHGEYEGELPLHYCGEPNPPTLHICDSVAVKPYIAHCRLGINIAGFAGLGFHLKHQKQLSELITNCNEIIYCPDAGDTENSKFWNAINKLSSWLANKNKEVTIAWWGQKSKSDGNDIDELDNLDNVDYLDFDEFVNKYSITIPVNNYQEEKEPEKTKVELCIEAIEKHFGKGALSFNLLRSEVEIKGEYSKDRLDNLYIELGRFIKHDCSKNLAYDCALALAKENSYHPVKDYLDTLKPPEKPVNIEKLSEHLFGTNEPIYNKMVYFFLIASVARIYQAGCKVDTCLVLNGEQGYQKSSFFRALFSDKWFNDNLRNLDRDNLVICHKHWCTEIDELDKITGKKEAGEVKAFLSKQEDEYRESYARTSVNHPRSFIIAGSSNKTEFLVDETGSRRFWIIPVANRIDIDWVKENRDAIWYQAKKDFDNGAKWWLDFEDEQLIQAKNQCYEVDDSWREIIEPKLIEHDYVTVHQIMTDILELDVKDITRPNQMRITNILKRLGYVKKRLTINGNQKYCWLPPETLPQSFQVGDSVEFMVGEMWFEGSIKAVNDDGTYDCWYSDLDGYSRSRKAYQIRPY